MCESFCRRNTWTTHRPMLKHIAFTESTQLVGSLPATTTCAPKSVAKGPVTTYRWIIGAVTFVVAVRRPWLPDAGAQ
jgi:hypothetical protein